MQQQLYVNGFRVQDGMQPPHVNGLRVKTRKPQAAYFAWAATTSKRGGNRARMSRATAAMPSSLLPDELLAALLLLTADDRCSSIMDSKKAEACAFFEVKAALSCSPNRAGGSSEGN